MGRAEVKGYAKIFSGQRQQARRHPFAASKSHHVQGLSVMGRSEGLKSKLEEHALLAADYQVLVKILYQVA